MVLFNLKKIILSYSYELSFTILSILHLFENPSKWSTFNRRIVSVKNFIAISLVVYAVGTTNYIYKDFEPFLTMLSSITPSNSA